MNIRRKLFAARRKILIAGGSVVALGFVVLLSVYWHYRGIVDERIQKPLFNDTAQIYGLPGPDGKPVPVTGLFDARRRSKRRILRYGEIPKVAIDAILSIEDRRFFDHNGINYGRLLKGIAAPLLGHGRMQGGSTLTMQMARGFFLSNRRTPSRKLAEMFIATELEHRLSKEQILEMYLNQVDMGQHGSFNIRGFGEAAQTYFGKDLSQVTLPEAATLAGIVNGPTYFSPYLHPDRAKTRRNLVLQAMFENHVDGKTVITAAELARAKAEPLTLAPPESSDDEAPYYVDTVRSQLLDFYTEEDLNNGGLQIYTALDPELQAVAVGSIHSGMERVDRLTHSDRAQVAMVALDPHTGEVLALSGGRSYGQSQFNRAASKRPTGSVFKPFVYAAALSSGLSDPEHALTEISPVDTSEGQFSGPGEPAYRPRNFDPSETGVDATLRFALAHSINTATVRLAEQVGYGTVASLAAASGMNGIKPTPSMAIGSYDATPLQLAGAYTAFANGGNYMEPHLLRSINRPDGKADRSFNVTARPVLDPRVAFIVTDMLSAVLTEGTASGLKTKLPFDAAGKTGTSHDAWFAGYSSNLLCVVWVGYDDYTDIKLEGAKAAAPIWAEFMAQAAKLPRYRDPKPFSPPPGVTEASIDKITNLPATDKCPDNYRAFFISGTVPRATCEHPDGDTRNTFQKMFGFGKKGGTLPAEAEGKEKKKGFWKRLFGGKAKPDEPEDLR